MRRLIKVIVSAGIVGWEVVEDGENDKGVDERKETVDGKKKGCDDVADGLSGGKIEDRVEMGETRPEFDRRGVCVEGKARED